jgi:hypothetical protein
MSDLNVATCVSEILQFMNEYVTNLQAKDNKCRLYFFCFCSFIASDQLDTSATHRSPVRASSLRFVLAITLTFSYKNWPRRFRPRSSKAAECASRRSRRMRSLTAGNDSLLAPLIGHVKYADQVVHRVSLSAEASTQVQP